MTTKEIFPLAIFPWCVFVVYWLIGATKTRAKRQQESFGSRYAVLLIEVVGLVLATIGSAVVIERRRCA